jgi:hypothetical protein
LAQPELAMGGWAVDNAADAAHARVDRRAPYGSDDVDRCNDALRTNSCDQGLGQYGIADP